MSRMDRVERHIRANRFWVLVWSIFFAIFAIVIAISLASQRGVKKGENPDAIYLSSLTCESNEYIYPFFTFDESVKSELRIIAIFGDNEFKTISLQQTLYYDDDESVAASEAVNHAAINISFGDNGLEADALGANFANTQGGMRFGLYETREKIEDEYMQYFLLDEAGGYDYEHVKRAYEELGMTCEGANV